ncbi:MAG: flagellar basal body rod protein FlgB [Clostridiales bacterium]|jgi:flagellar basal-body rod protein FlgB|uniref:flagellar basal body rod protein FlgB n=1 Tax=Bovifimicola ammoniilytica TaxID=2981720 RepID=UPI00033D51E6|nr:flagellar basal body rod protein FlgB [Bovifimicola ammoniilytica]MBD8941811.1 flagellar basal body rod protein FlgB [Clostridiales bacterium]MCU6753197.1 flagellar basal body rod protein FlgB [Bovifimicola ammoniilytica]CCZ05328.1 flagellar basal body rod protein FlgB [Eubacterium sp. CAG:603]SCJ56786.1 Flagellar basal body rod protein FlgB [uncultured Eubacterium sp.]
MINSSIYNYVNVLDKAADASWIRNEVISNNIANVDTPNYKRQDVEFESYLLAQLEGANSSSLKKTVAGMDLDSLTSTIYTDSNSLSYRLDGNNVDIDTENVELASNQLKYQALVSSINNEFSMIKSAMQ